MVSVYHIVSERRIESPVTAFCGKELDRINGSYVWADQVGVDKEYIFGKHCQPCLDSDDYSLYLLANAGEGEDPNEVWKGVATGRLSAFAPNTMRVPQGMRKQDVLRIAHEIQDNISETIMSPTNYEDLERRLRGK